MLAPPWPPAPGPCQPRDAHASAWTNDVGRALALRHAPPAPPVDVVASWGRSGAGPAARDAGGRAQERDQRPGDGPEQDPAPHTHRIPVRWEPQAGWIPDPTPAPEQRWTPEQDWVRVFGLEPAPSSDDGQRPSPARAARRWVLALVVTVPFALVAALVVVLT